MSRIRTIKPEFFTDEDLFDAEQESGLPLRIAFAGLWTQADREGRFEWRPRPLKVAIMPYDNCDFARVLDVLAGYGFIVRYSPLIRNDVEQIQQLADASLTREARDTTTREFGYIPTWHKHQVVNHRESASVLPDPAKCSVVIRKETQQNQIVADASSTREDSVPDEIGTRTGHARGERKGKERKGEVLKALNTLAPSCEKNTPTPPEPSTTKSAVVYVLPLPRNMSHEVTEEDVALYRECYPGVDVFRQLGKMKGWLLADTRRLKTPGRGMKRAIASWLGRAQNEPHFTGGPYGSNGSTDRIEEITRTGKGALDILARMDSGTHRRNGSAEARPDPRRDVESAADPAVEPHRG